MFSGQSPVEKVIRKFGHWENRGGGDLIISIGSIISDVLHFFDLTHRWTWHEASGLGVWGEE